MKYIIVLADGMADYPIPELNNRTPLMYASTPNMDHMAFSAELGLVKTVPEGFPPGSDVANLSVMGYDPREYYTGRSPLEALSMGIDLKPEDVAFRCNLVTLDDNPDYAKKVMMDYSSDEITTGESGLLIGEVSSRLSSPELRFYPGISYRHLMVWTGGSSNIDLTPPHDISDRVIGKYLPRGEGSQTLLKLMEASNTFLKDHPVNQDRIRKNLRPATSLWFWGQGRKPAITSFENKYGLKGSVISAVDLTRGLGIAAGLKPVIVPGATGNISTNFYGKATAALEELKQGQDFVYIHIEAPDEAGHRGELDTKIKAIEEIDEKVVGVLLQGLHFCENYRIMILPDHPTPLSTRTHASDEVPFLIYEKGSSRTDGPETFSEETARCSGQIIQQGFRLMDHFLRK
ncbi:MAG: cofactor-independent phosphoglycerate mutase [Chitinophagales bacterium]